MSYPYKPADSLLCIPSSKVLVSISTPSFGVLFPSRPNFAVIGMCVLFEAKIYKIPKLGLNFKLQLGSGPTILVPNVARDSRVLLWLFMPNLTEIGSPILANKDTSQNGAFRPLLARSFTRRGNFRENDMPLVAKYTEYTACLWICTCTRMLRAPRIVRLRLAHAVNEFICCRKGVMRPFAKLH